MSNRKTLLVLNLLTYFLIAFSSEKSTTTEEIELSAFATESFQQFQFQQVSHKI